MKLVYTHTTRFFALERGDNRPCCCKGRKNRPCKEPAGMLVQEGDHEATFCWQHYQQVKETDWPDYEDLRGHAQADRVPGPPNPPRPARNIEVG